MRPLSAAGRRSGVSITEVRPGVTTKDSMRVASRVLPGAGEGHRRFLLQRRGDREETGLAFLLEAPPASQPTPSRRPSTPAWATAGQSCCGHISAEPSSALSDVECYASPEKDRVSGGPSDAHRGG